MIHTTRIVFIGAGNMATRLAISLYECGYPIVQVYSRTIQSAQTLAQMLGDDVSYTNDLSQVVNDAHLYIFSLSDAALPDVVSKMPHNNAMWVHTAGSMPMDVFSGKTQHYGVLYPMQTASKERSFDWTEVPIFIEAASSDDLNFIENIAQSLSNQVVLSTSQQRQALHLAAVFACNFSNHMYAIAEKLLAEQGLKFDVMKFLIRETEHKAENISPLKAQTGPAVRNDENVMHKHLSLLRGTPECELYRMISESIIQYNSNK